ncbi:MAG TPA: ABC transporter permease [Candidatus Olsenella avistercoris]|nr:ABC transporter permease [Candidatus Olsenella avistercoris]
MSKLTSRVLWTAASLAFFILVWQLYVTIGNVATFVLPQPLDVLIELKNQLTSGALLPEIGTTAFETIAGFLLGAVLGMMTGYFVYRSETVRITLMPFLVFFQVAPKIALVPIFIIWFGLGMFSKLFVVFSMVFFPIALGMNEGLSSIPSTMRDLMSVLRSSRAQTFLKLELPHALPQLFSSFKVGIVQALIGATVAEWMSGQGGLGYIQTNASSTFNTPLLMVGILVTIALGLVLWSIISFAEKRTCFWSEVN